MQCLKVLCAIVFLFMLSMESKSSAELTQGLDGKPIDPVALRVGSDLSDDASARSASPEPEVIPSLIAKHINKNGVQGQYILHNISSHEDLLQKFSQCSKVDCSRIDAVIYPFVGEYKDVETFKEFISFVAIQSEAFKALIQIFEKPT